MHPLREQIVLDINKSYAFNMSLMKYAVNYEHNVYGTQQRVETYDYEDYNTFEYKRFLNLTQGNSYRNLTFNFNNRVKEYTIDIPGTRELFGIIGGTIILLFFSFSCCITSFN